MMVIYGTTMGITLLVLRQDFAPARGERDRLLVVKCVEKQTSLSITIPNLLPVPMFSTMTDS